MKNNYREMFLSILVLFMTVSSLKILNEDWFLLILSATLIVFFLYRKIRVDNFFIFIVLYWVFINFIAFTVFQEDINSVLFTFFGSLMRITLVYLLLKLSGPNLFYNAERVSFWILIIGFIIFFGIEFIGPAEAILKGFNLGAWDTQAVDGGWNILVYARNPWHMFRFTGYAWEPGAAALIILFSLIITIYRDGYQIDRRKIIYVIMLIFTFSTAAYLAFVFLMLFYFINVGLKKYGFAAILLIPALVPIIIMVYNLEFMSGKINEYQRVSSKNQRYGFENTTGERVTRYDYVFLSLEQISKWPLGYGVSSNGLIKSRLGVPISGANALFTFLVNWGVIGFLFMLFAFARFFRLLSIHRGIKHNYLLLIALMIIFFSNPVERSPLFIGIILYPFIFNYPTDSRISKFNPDQATKNLRYN